MNKKFGKKTEGQIFFVAVFFIATIFFAGFAHAQENAYVVENLLNQDPDPAEPGKYLELRWQVLKQGNKDIEKITYELEEKYPFSFDASDSPVKTIDKWLGVSDDEEYYILYYKVKVAEDAIEGDYEITLKSTTINNAETIVKEGDYTIRVGDKTRPDLLVGAISTSPRKLVSDTEEGQINVEIENIGNSDAYNVNAVLVLPTGFSTTYSYSDTDAVGTIPAGQSKMATFYVDIDEKVWSGLHPAELQIRYKEDMDKTDYYNAELPLNLSIISRPVFEIESVESNPSPIHPGDVVELKLKIKNSGGKDAESVSVKAFKESSQPFEFDEKSDFIGSLNAGETGEAIIKFTVDKDAVPKKHIMDLEIRSINEDNVVLDSVSVPVEIGSASGNFFSKVFTLNNIIIVVLALAVVFLGYRLYEVHK